MRRVHKPSPSARFVQPRPGAWAITKSSTNRISPFNRREISELLKASSASQPTSKLGVPRTDKENSKDPEGYVLKRKSSKLINTLKAKLEKDSRLFNARFQELQPTFRSLTSEATPRLRNSRTISHRMKISAASVADTPKIIEKDNLGNGQLAPPNLEGEKLVTVGGYIISLQEVNEKIVGIIRPRVSSDKHGLELEIKILGCNPTDVKFEKRYDTLIVIGVSKSIIKKLEDIKDPGGSKEGPNVFASTIKSMMSNRDFGTGSGSHYSTAPEQEYLEDLYEIINIFIPKNVSTSQIFISKPDAKGRIFVKGP